MIIDNENYSLTGSQVKDVAGRIKANHDSIGELGSALGTKQDALTTEQLAAVNSGIDSTKVGQIATNTEGVASNLVEIDQVKAKIPAQASSSNQLADKSFVTDAVQTNSAHFRGNWATWSDVPTDPTEYPIDDDGNHTPTSNDYMVVQDASGFPTSPDPALEGTWRFKYSGVWDTNGKNGWHPEYQVNETPLTSDQLAALNSGITAEAVTKLGGIETGAEVNDINSISVNGTAVTPDANKNVALTIPAESIKTLTTNDYNWPTSGTATCVALWLLDRGLYKIGDNVSYMPFKLTNAYTGDGKIVYSVGPSRSNHKVVMSLATTPPTIYYPHFSSGDASGYLAENSGELMTFNSILNLLDSTSTTHALSAAQGKVLNDTKADKTAFTGTDGTAAGAMGLVPAPATTDAGKVLGADGSWTGLPEGIRTLTTADYNYHTSGDTHDGVGIWLLENGLYKAGGVLVVYTNTSNTRTIPAGTLIIKSYQQIIVFTTGSSDSSAFSNIGTIGYWLTSPEGQPMGMQASTERYGSSILKGTSVANSLTIANSGRQVLDAYQGKVLADRIGDLTILTTTAKTSAVAAINELDSDLGKVEPLSGSGAPTTSTVGAVGQFYVDTTTGDIYYLSAIVPGTDPDPDTYTWNKVAKGADVPTIVQTTGTSQTDVMSQDATTGMIYADPSTKSKVLIGGSSVGNATDAIVIGRGASTKGDYSMAIGSTAGSQVTNAPGGISLGAFSNANGQGQMDISLRRATSQTQAQCGYNGSEYRLLTGLYDPQSDHDGATKGYVDTKATITMTTTDPGEGATINANELIGFYS